LLEDLGETFGQFADEYGGLFCSGNHNVAKTAQQYLRGLMQSDKRNMERMVEAVPDSDYQVLQNFLTHSSWEYRAVMDRVAVNTNGLLGGKVGTGLYLDESAFAKKGDQSVGWRGSGTVGWVSRTTVRLECSVPWEGPIEWALLTRDCTCQRSGRRIHDDAIAPTFPDLSRSIEPSWSWPRRSSSTHAAAGCALTGNSLEFLQSLPDQGEIFVADVHSDRHIYLSDPAPYLPPQDRGRPRIRHVSDARPMEVRKWVKSQPASRWRRKTLRNTTKGRLVVEVLHERVWLWDKHSPSAHRWHLIVRREIDSPGTIKYCLSNAPEKTSLIKLVQMQAQRFWVERAFQDAKSHVGMAQYQARQWQSWHRHMALVMLTMQFMLQTRLEHVQTHPLLSCYDIQILLAKTLPDRRNSREEILRQLQIRHQQRQASIESARSG
jgi:SRSO17 transposase